MRSPSRTAAIAAGLLLCAGLVSAAAATAGGTPPADDSSAMLRASLHGSLTDDWATAQMTLTGAQR
jgi:hypothetical protein